MDAPGGGGAPEDDTCALVDDGALAALAECFPDAAPGDLAAALAACANDVPGAIDWVMASQQAAQGEAESRADAALPLEQGAETLPPQRRDVYWRARRAFPDVQCDAVAAAVCATQDEDARTAFAAVCRVLGRSPEAAACAVPRRLRTERLDAAVRPANGPPQEDGERTPTLDERLDAFFCAYGPLPEVTGDPRGAAMELRRRAADAHDARAVAAARAQEAHAQSGPTGLGAASFYADRARVLRADALALSRAAAFLVFVAHNPRPHARTLDLHGLTVDEATALLAIFLECVPLSPLRPLRVVAGAGRHSGRAGARLRPAVHRLLAARGASFTHDDMATFHVTLVPRARQ